MKRPIMALSCALALFPFAKVSAERSQIEVYKTNSCGCCVAWMNHLDENGFETTGHDMFGGSLLRFKLDNGVPQRMVSRHTGLIDGYVIEGHVPAADMARLLDERPEAVGLAVPKMPLGSPGMDQDNRRDAYDVFLINKDGSTEVFACYPGN